MPMKLCFPRTWEVIGEDGSRLWYTLWAQVGLEGQFEDVMRQPGS